MSKVSSVIGRACSGVSSRSFHQNWHDVSPVPVGKTKADYQHERREWAKRYNAQTRKLRQVKVWRNGVQVYV